MSRSTIESLRLGELAADTGVRVIGASDGIDRADQQSKLVLSGPEPVSRDELLRRRSAAQSRNG